MPECEDGTGNKRHLVDEFSLQKFVDLYGVHEARQQSRFETEPDHRRCVQRSL